MIYQREMDPERRTRKMKGKAGAAWQASKRLPGELVSESKLRIFLDILEIEKRVGTGRATINNK